MPDHLLSWTVGVAVGCLLTVAVTIGTRVQLLPEVVDISLVPTLAGVFSILSAAAGAACRFPLERIGRLTLFGTLLGGGLAAAFLAVALIVDVLS